MQQTNLISIETSGNAVFLFYHVGKVICLTNVWVAVCGWIFGYQIVQSIQLDWRNALSAEYAPNLEVSECVAYLKGLLQNLPRHRLAEQSGYFILRYLEQE